jgi:hypothetical protein
MFDEIIKKMITILHSNQKTFLYPQKLKVQNLKKESNTLMRVFCKHHGLNYFGLGYWKGIAYAQNYSMHMQYPY